MNIHYIPRDGAAVACQKWAEVSRIVCIVLSCYCMCASGFLFTHSNTELNLAWFLETVEKLKQKIFISSFDWKIKYPLNVF